MANLSGQCRRRLIDTIEPATSAARANIGWADIVAAGAGESYEKAKETLFGRASGDSKAEVITATTPATTAARPAATTGGTAPRFGNSEGSISLSFDSIIAF